MGGVNAPPSFNMPTYIFSKDGIEIERIVPSDISVWIDEDGEEWKRVSRPIGFNVNTGAKAPDQRDGIKSGYYKAEQKGWRSKYSKKQIKKAWNL